MIGHGYMYVGFQPQITYSVPTMSGFNGSIGLFNLEATVTDNSGNVIAQRHNPGVQALGSCDWKGTAPGKVWLAGLAQNVGGVNGNKSTNTAGLEGGLKLGFGDAEVVVCGFSRKGLGICAVGALLLGTSKAKGSELKSGGFLTQSTCKVMPDLKLGINYGQNKDQDQAAVGTDTKRARHSTAGSGTGMRGMLWRQWTRP